MSTVVRKSSFVFAFVFVFAFSYICKWSRWYSFSIRRWLVRVPGKRGVFAHISFFSETILQRRSNWPLISHFQPTFRLKKETFCSIFIQGIKDWGQLVAKIDPYYHTTILPLQLIIQGIWDLGQFVDKNQSGDWISPRQGPRTPTHFHQQVGLGTWLDFTWLSKNSESKDVRAAIEEEKFPSPKAPIITFFWLKLWTLSLFDLKNG